MPVQLPMEPDSPTAPPPPPPHLGYTEQRGREKPVAPEERMAVGYRPRIILEPPLRENLPPLVHYTRYPSGRTLQHRLLFSKPLTFECAWASLFTNDKSQGTGHNSLFEFSWNERQYAIELDPIASFQRRKLSKNQMFTDHFNMYLDSNHYLQLRAVNSDPSSHHVSRLCVNYKNPHHPCLQIPAQKSKDKVSVYVDLYAIKWQPHTPVFQYEGIVVRPLQFSSSHHLVKPWCFNHRPCSDECTLRRPEDPTQFFPFTPNGCQKIPVRYNTYFDTHAGFFDCLKYRAGERKEREPTICEIHNQVGRDVKLGDGSQSRGVDSHSEEEGKPKHRPHHVHTSSSEEDASQDDREDSSPAPSTPDPSPGTTEASAVVSPVPRKRFLKAELAIRNVKPRISPVVPIRSLPLTYIATPTTPILAKHATHDVLPSPILAVAVTPSPTPVAAIPIATPVSPLPLPIKAVSREPSFKSVDTANAANFDAAAAITQALLMLGEAAAVQA